MKAQSELIWHSISIAVTLGIIMVILLTLGNIRDEFKDYISNEEIKQVCYNMRSAINIVYEKPDYRAASNSTLSAIYFDLPQRIADENYRISTAPNKSLTVSIAAMQKNFTCRTGISADISGTAAGGRAKVTWTSLENGTDMIEMGGA